MLSRVLNYVKNLFGPSPTHHIQQNNEEHHTISKKRPGDLLNSNDSSPSKRICTETRMPIAGPIGKEIPPRQALPLDSEYFLKPDLRQICPTMPRKSNPSIMYCSTNPMDSKSRGASFSSPRSPNHGKENIIEISDEDDDDTRKDPLTKSRADRATWVNAVPKYNPTSKTFQHSCYKEKSKIVKDNFSSGSKSPGFTHGRTQHWPVLESSRTTSTSRLSNRFVRKNTVNRSKRFDNRIYHPLPPSALRGIEETFRLEEKNSYSQLLKHYETQSFDKKQRSAGCHSTTTSKFSGVFDNQSTMLVSYTKTKGKIEFIDLTKRMKDLVPKVQRDQEIKPQTLASKIAEGSKEIATTSRPKDEVSKTNSFDEILKLYSWSKPMFLEDTLKRFEERNRDTRKSLQEPLLRAEQYGRRNDEVHIERVLRHITITDSEVVLDDVLEDEVPKLPILAPRMQEAIDNALKPSPPHETLVESFSLKITRRDMNTLANLNWLNDEVINYYMNLLIERGKSDKFPSVYAFNTFFYTKLVTTGFATLKRWTRKIDVFSYNLIIVPVHLGVHWCMAAIDFRDKTIRYFDSMGNPNNKCLNALAHYLEEESIDKKKTAYDTSSWKKINVKDNPHQMNGSDCGVFACIYAEYICRDAKITFTQTNMPYFRRKMVYEILSAELLDFS